MSYFMVDVEADGPIPGEYSMVCLGVVIVDPHLNRTFYGADQTDLEAVGAQGACRFRIQPGRNPTI